MSLNEMKGNSIASLVFLKIHFPCVFPFPPAVLLNSVPVIDLMYRYWYVLRPAGMRTEWVLVSLPNFTCCAPLFHSICCLFCLLNPFYFSVSSIGGHRHPEN
jgi:hypothetical protein